MKTSSEGRRLITLREGLRLSAYKDSVGIPTIGVGHTTMAGIPEVRMGMAITKAEADAILSRDLQIFESTVNHHVKVPLTQNEFDALVSFTFNVGGHAFIESTLLKKLNAGNKKAAADQLLVWNRAGGKTLKGLTSRRNAERAQFLGAL